MQKFRQAVFNTFRNGQRNYSKSSSDGSGNSNNPIKRTFQLIKNDLKKVNSAFSASSAKTENDFDQNNNKQGDEFQTHCDVLVVGGGCIGASVAFWLKKKARDGLNVVVVEKDPTVSTLD